MTAVSGSFIEMALGHFDASFSRVMAAFVPSDSFIFESACRYSHDHQDCHELFEPLRDKFTNDITTAF